MTDKWKLGFSGVQTEILSAALNCELSRFYICSATRSIGSVLLIKIGPSDEIVATGDLAAAKSYQSEEWSIFVFFASWQVDISRKRLIHSDDDGGAIDLHLGQLVGKKIEAIKFSSDGSLILELQSGLELKIDGTNVSEASHGNLWTIFRRRDWSLALSCEREFGLEVYNS